MRTLRSLLPVIAVAAVLSQGCTGSGFRLPTRGSEAVTTSTGDGVQVLPRRPSRPGYERGCGRGKACVFGPAWSDDVDVASGRNGCDTRNDVLRRDLRDVQLKAGTRGCVVLSGTLHDPYTGTVVRFNRATAGDAAQVQIDHVYSLSAAWDFGAADWSARKRRAFANDPRNLLATSRAVNAAKGDQTPAGWMPPVGRCRFAAAYLDVAAAYELAISRADAAVLHLTRARCS